MFELSKHGIVDVIGGEGAFCAESLDELNPLVEKCLSMGPPSLVVDLSGVPFIDSAGLEWLLDVQDRCVGSGGMVRLAAPNGLCGEILHVTGVGAQIEAFDDVLHAAGSFAR